MNIKEKKELIKTYLDQDLIFSALQIWEGINKEHFSEFMKFQYADTLRLCVHHSEAKELFNQTDIDEIPSVYRYLFYLFYGTLLTDMNQIETAKEVYKKCIEFKECDTVPFV